MTLRIVYRPRAGKELGKLAEPDKARVIARIVAFAAEPDGLGHDVVKMVGYAIRYRLRVGSWRVIFDRHGDHILVTTVAHRREVYR